MILLASALFLLFATVANCDASAAASCAPSVHDSVAFVAAESLHTSAAASCSPSVHNSATFLATGSLHASAAVSCAPSVHDSAAFLATGSPSVHDPCNVLLAFGSPSILLFLAPLAAAALGGLWDGFCEYSGIVRDNKEIILLGQCSL